MGGPASSSEDAGMELTDSVELEELDLRPDFLTFLGTAAVAMMICLFIALVGTSYYKNVYGGTKQANSRDPLTELGFAV